MGIKNRRTTAASVSLFFLGLLLSLVLFSSSQAAPATATTSSPSKEVEESFQDNEFIRVIVSLKASEKGSENSHSLGPSHSAQKTVESLQKTAAQSAEPVKKVLQQKIEEGNIKDTEFYWIVNAFSAKVNEEGFAAITSLPQVERITRDRAHTLQTSVELLEENTEHDRRHPEHLPAWNLESINAPRAWQKGVFGKDVVVAIMDTGVDPAHPALRDNYRGNQEGHDHQTSWFDVTTELEGEGAQEPNDPNGHGTHIAGIILGGTPSSPQGVAPAAQWMAVNIFSEGYAWDSQIIKAFQWLLAPNDNPDNAPDIINCSWASRPDYVADPLQWELLQNLEQAGIFVVFAAGNNGPAGPGSPASFPHAFSVGALKYEDGGALRVADFSSRGHVDWNGISYPKPELTAPGTNITSTWPGEGYYTLNGTSMAAAHVTGTAALLLDAQPDLKPYQVGYTLKQSARWDRSWGEEERPDARYGYGMVDAFRAISRDTLPPEENLFRDSVEEEIVKWNTSPALPWKISREKAQKGDFAYADSPWSKYPGDAESWLSIAEPILLCGYHHPVLTFSHFYDLNPGQENEEKDYAYVEVSPNNQDWVRLYRFSGTNNEFETFSLPLYLPPGENELYLRFRLKSNNSEEGEGWYIDDIQVNATPLPLTSLDALELKPEANELGLNESVQIDAEALFCSKVSRPIDADKVRWSSSDSSVAIVNKGRVKGVSPGEVIIKGEFAGKRAEVEMEVIQVAAPEASPPAGLYYHSVEVKLIPPRQGAEIRYTLDGSDPDHDSPLYEEPFKLEQTTILKARAYENGIPGPVQLLPYNIREGSKVVGRIHLQGRSAVDEKTEAAFVCQEIGTRYAVHGLQRDGTFSQGLPLGDYFLVIKRDKYLGRVMEVIITEKNDPVIIPPVKLFAGDLTGSNTVGLSDLSILTAAFDSKPSDEHWNSSADINGDGVINFKDLELLKQNYGKKGEEL